MIKTPSAYRGFMLDPARHYIPLEETMRLLDAAGRLGFNRFHWHLTDDQGWRIEIKRYPRLTEAGSVRGRSCFWGEDEYENNSGYYTQEDIRRVVAFARERGIEIVPEIEIPGHASAMLAAYPEVGCRRKDGTKIVEMPYEYKVLTTAGVFPNLICAGREDSVTFLENILEEVTELFPGPEVHIGGDEAVKLHWRRCPDCQRRMRENGLKTENELQRWLVMRMGEFLKKRGKRTIVWNESLAGGMLPHNFIVQHWLFHDAETKRFMAEGGDVICSDVNSYYISRQYCDQDAYLTWKTPNMPEYAKGNEGQLLGYESPLWGERITNPKRAEHMLFPRLPIIAMRANGDAYPATWGECVHKLRALRDDTLKDLHLNWAGEENWKLSDEEAASGRAEEARKRELPGMPEVIRVNDLMLLQDQLERLLQEIDMPAAFAQQVRDISFCELKDYCGSVTADRSNGAGELNRHLMQALKNRDYGGVWYGKPQEIWLDTMKCFTRFVNEHFRQYGFYGFDRGFWTTRQINARLFRIGELEYELLKDENGKSLALHIPSDAVLEADRLNASLCDARAFMKEFYPDWSEAPVTLRSWLLSQELESCFPEEGHIRRFRKAFDIQETEEDCLEAVLEWVFEQPREKCGGEDLDALPEKTRLQRSIKAYLLKGGRVCEAAGLLAREFK